MTRGEADDERTVEYRYDGRTHRIAWRYPDSAVDSGWKYPVYDDRWRMIALHKPGITDEMTSVTPLVSTELFHYHAAGLDGAGGSNYVDLVIRRDRDAVVDESDPESPTGQGILEEALWYLQNWRGDVIAMISTYGMWQENIRYSAYGRPYAVAAAAHNLSGSVSLQDLFDFIGDYSSSDPATKLRADYNVTGAYSTQDYYDWQAAYYANTSASGGRDRVASDSLPLNGTASGNRKGYAGYEHDPREGARMLARHRYYRGDTGAWMSRDLLEYEDGFNLYEYVGSAPLDFFDPTGLVRDETGSAGGQGGCGFNCGIGAGGTPPITLPVPDPLDDLKAIGRWFIDGVNSASRTVCSKLVGSAPPAAICCASVGAGGLLFGGWEIGMLTCAISYSQTVELRRRSNPFDYRNHPDNQPLVIPRRLPGDLFPPVSPPKEKPKKEKEKEKQKDNRNCVILLHQVDSKARKVDHGSRSVHTPVQAASLAGRSLFIAHGKEIPTRSVHGQFPNSPLFQSQSCCSSNAGGSVCQSSCP